MTTQNTKSKRPRSAPASASGLPEEVVDRLAGLLPPEALEDAVKGLEPEEITGPGGLVSRLAGRVVETALGAELSEHLGYPPGQAPPGGAGNVRNGSTAKTVTTELGPVAVKTPRDRKGTFEPKLVRKRQTRLAGLDERVLGLYAGGMSVRDIAQHLSDLYGVEIGRDTISRVTDAVLDDVEAWRSRPLEAIYPIVYRAVNADSAAEALQAFDQTWGERYPMIADSWRARWEHITPFLALPAELRRAVALSPRSP